MESTKLVEYLTLGRALFELCTYITLQVFLGSIRRYSETSSRKKSIQCIGTYSTSLQQTRMGIILIYLGPDLLYHIITLFIYHLVGAFPL